MSRSKEYQGKFYKGKGNDGRGKKVPHCGEVSHLARNCNKIMEKGGSEKIEKQVKCYNCGKNGHMQ